GLLVLALIALIAGLVLHSFIIGANVNDWWKGRSVTPVDQIATSLAISRMCAQCATSIFLLRTTFLLMRNLDSYISLFIMVVFYDFFSYANICLTSLLSIVYCLKISNFHTRLFLYLRRVIVHRTVHFTVGSVLLSTFSCFIPLLMTIIELTKGGTYNTTMADLSSDSHNKYVVYIYIIGDFFPLLFYYISSAILFISWYHHTTNIEMSSNVSINLETYYSVMKCISFTFTYNTLYFIVGCVGIFYYSVYCVSLDWLLIVLEFLPALHSFHLFYRTNKLRRQMSKGLQNVMHFLIHNKNAETRDNI
ncbi:hypothetical protein GDO78_022758, partial [Eleutherodactylus coqui]